MVTTSFLKFLLADDVSLNQYAQGNFVGFAEVRRSLFIKGREQNRNVPDHYYRLEESRSFEGISSIAEILTVGLAGLAGQCLELANGRIYVKSEMQNDWQELITHIPPLLLQSAFLNKHVPPGPLDSDFSSYFNRYLVPNTRYTALPSPQIAQLDHLVNAQNGLHDLHMHLNGATETDVLWQDYLFEPMAIYQDIRAASAVAKVREQLLQESPLLTPPGYISLLKIARKLRSYFYCYFFPWGPEATIFQKSALLNKIINPFSEQPGSYRHEFIALLSDKDQHPHLMAVEALMNILILNELERSGNETLAEFFHFYLLILGLTNRLLVQQVHQKGFEQFQKHTLNRMREQSEQKYKKRYLQMHGNDARNLHFLEGRFAPKDTQDALVRMIKSITGGWKAMKEELAEASRPVKEISSIPELKLIAHFIKGEDSKPDSRIRHKKLRYGVWQQARVLSNLLNQHPRYKSQLVAIDAAASEFDAPAEVFAPAFRFLRRMGVQHFTYHAGEDFYHIICGLRSVFEAIVFCGLQKGDRIGHATATGISVRQWYKEIGDQILISKGEYLDSLVFAYHFILLAKIDRLDHLIPAITAKILHLNQEIYSENFPLAVLEKAWLMRQLCPVHAFLKNREDMATLSVFNQEEWEFATTSRLIKNRRTMEQDKSWQAYLFYHDKKYREAYDAVISIEPFEIFTPQQIELLQLGILGYMNKREIIIETLPTSNVRIGFHRNFNTYHLMNWIMWRKTGESIPPVVVGTDDTGIFATNIYNEYANIYCCLINEKSLSHPEVMQIIKQLDQDSRIYRFK